ncbi:hypothetical protein, partial [Caballeronia ptereochthonis]|uniref:hypothetical protein n=1 Tax=Caballeronia ptereochthonis TaxID=1777144 RepID=UPI001ABF593D
RIAPTALPPKKQTPRSEKHGVRQQSEGAARRPFALGPRHKGKMRRAPGCSTMTLRPTFNRINP